ncbi:hypothetical protein GE061_020104 [Apolygus lucorum]|uniref:Uncharacterized protein n=1 Tax=Apolygus lucorum TaxID=248454 RepID=A0A8S9XCD2_APOLU|nr:hypothetical protein GE061_020104 [Apolygus lucorum]
MNMSVGNLVSPLHVLTSCLAVADIRTIKLSDGSTTYVMASKNPRRHIVMYASSYHFEEVHRYTGEVGRNYVKRMAAHPFSSSTSLKYCYGVVTMAGEIKTYLPFLSVMPLEIYSSTINGVGVPDPKVEPLEPSADDDYHVVTWGRDVYDDKAFRNPMLIDFKIKYRVAISQNRQCDFTKYKIYRNINEQTSNLPLKDSLVGVYCMEMVYHPRKLGIVCDHDRGAPIVQRGKVIAIVIRGADEQHCNVLTPKPFWVASIHDTLPMFMHISRYALHAIFGDKHGQSFGIKMKTSWLTFLVSSCHIFVLIKHWLERRTFKISKISNSKAE